eukprot:3874-Heterococcus_DN1.PRE.5
MQKSVRECSRASTRRGVCVKERPDVQPVTEKPHSAHAVSVAITVREGGYNRCVSSSVQAQQQRLTNHQ